MSRIVRAIRAFITPDRLADTEPVARNSDIQRAVRGFPRDRPIGYTIAPNPARQIWELHRIREESRQQALVNPFYSGGLEWAKQVVIGTKPFGLKFPSVPAGEGERLRDATLYLRDQWRAYQEMEIGIRDETLSELASQVQDWMLVDGDSFIIPRRFGTEWRYHSYAGDALAETGHSPATIGAGKTPQRALGITLDIDGRPEIYHFRQRARNASLGYTGYSTGVDAMPVAASQVWHIRDRQRWGGSVRGWPWISAAYEYLSRTNEFHQAFVRAAIRRVAASIALERDPGMTAGAYDRDDDIQNADLTDVRIEGQGEFTDESIKPYQEAEAAAGNMLELEPGYKAVQITTGVPSAQEAEILKQFHTDYLRGARRQRDEPVGRLCRREFQRRPAGATGRSAQG